MTDTDLRERLHDALPVPPRLLSLDELVRLGRRRQRTRFAGGTAALGLVAALAGSAAFAALGPERGGQTQPAAGVPGPEIGRTVGAEQVVPVGPGVTGQAAGPADVLAVAEPGGQELLGYTTNDGASCLQIRGDVTGSCLAARLGPDPYARAEAVAVASSGVSVDKHGNLLTAEVPFWGALPAGTRTVRFTGSFGTREVRAYAGGARYADRAFVLAYLQPGRDAVLLQALDANGTVLASRRYRQQEPPLDARG